MACVIGHAHAILVERVFDFAITQRSFPEPVYIHGYLYGIVL